MQIWVHDTSMRKVTAINNDIPRMLSFYNSTWHRYLPQATNTFDFTIPKLYSGKLHEDLSFINDRAFFSFRNQGKDYVFYVANMIEDDLSIQLTCNDTNLELNNEQANAFSSDSAQTLTWYLEHMDLLAFASMKIGTNEISDRKRTLTFDSQETKLARLQSLMSQFDAEYEFATELNNNGTFKQITLNIYQSPDSTHHGVGKVRSDVLLYYGNDVKGVQVTTDKTQLFNMAVFTGQDGLSMKDVERSDKNEDGKEEFYTRKGNEAVYAPLSVEMYPSTLRDGDNWTRKDFQTEYTDVNDLTAYAFRTMKQYAYPIITYTASVQSSFLGNYSDLALGDTVKIYDGNFVGGLALEARVTEQIISFDNPNNNSLVFSNYVKLKNTVSATLQKRLAELVEANTPYTIKLARNNSLIFKNGQGETIITPSLYKADKPITADVTWRWSLDGNVTNSMIYTIKAADVTEQSVLTVAAYIGNDEVATTEIDVINVNDGVDGAQGPQGPQGPKGDRGEDGIAGKDGVGLKSTVVTYGLSTSETTQPTSWTAQVPTLTKGNYLWTKTIWTYTDNTSETGYQKTYIAKDGNDGADGIAGKDGVGLVNTTLRYSKSNDGVNKPTGSVIASFPDKITPSRSAVDNFVMTGKYVHLEQGKTYILSAETNGDFTNQHSETVSSNNATIWIVNPSFSTWLVISDSNTSSGTKYTHTRPTGDYEIRVNSYTPDNSTWVKNIVFEDGTWSPDIPVVNPGEFLWTRTTWFYSDDTIEQGFSVAKMGEKGDKGDKGETGERGPQGIQGLQGPKGDQGIQGPKGADGKTQYTHIAYADNATGGGFSQTDQNKAYIGMYQDFTATDSNDPTRYRWTKWKGSDGAQGIPGKPGADGKTPYIHFAYANDNRGTNFSLTDNNQRYQGYYSDYTEADSTDYRRYKWVDRLANVQIGTVNLIKGTGSAFVMGYGITNTTWNETKKQTILDFSTPGVRRDISDEILPQQNKFFDFKPIKGMTYTQSIMIDTDATFEPNGQAMCTWFTPNGHNFQKAYIKKVGDYSYQVWSTYTWNLDDVALRAFDWYNLHNILRFRTTGTYLAFYKPKMTTGNLPSDWEAAPEDVQDQINDKADQELTQEQLNALAEKNALIQAEMEAKASMDTVNQWITAYQNYVNANNADKKKSEQALQDASNRLLQVQYDVKDLKQQWNFIDTYMSVQNEGLIIGKKDGSAYAKFSNDRISLFSGNSEVMYISQGTLNIANGIFTKTIQIGRFRFETHPADVNMLVIRYLGG